MQATTVAGCFRRPADTTIAAWLHQYYIFSGEYSGTRIVERAGVLRSLLASKSRFSDCILVQPYIAGARAQSNREQKKKRMER
jgi:hypothetical protein